MKPDWDYLAMLDRREEIAQLRPASAGEVGPDVDDGEDADVGQNHERLAGLRKRLEQAIAQENYECAAKLRDEIGRVEGDRRSSEG